MPVSDADYKVWLETPEQQRCALFILKFLGAVVGSPTVGEEYSAYLSNGPYITAAGDTPANQIFDECVLDLPSFTRRMGEQLNGRSTQSFGDLIIDNANNERIDWLSMNWDGRSIKQYLGDPSWAFDDFRLVLDGAIDDVFDVGGNRIGFKISDKAALLERPIMTTLLGGDGPDAGDLMPLALGNDQNNIRPRLYDVATGFYKISAVDYAGIVERLDEDNEIEVYEDRNALTDAITVASVDTGTEVLTSVDHGLFVNSRVIPGDLGSGVPAPLVAGDNYWVIASGLTSDEFKLSATRGGAAINLTTDPGAFALSVKNWTMDFPNGGFWVAGNPSGLITAHMTHGLLVGVGADIQYSPGDLIIQVLTSGLTNTPLTSADIDLANFAALKTLLGVGPQVSYYLTEHTTFAELFDRLMLSVGGWWGFSRDGLLQIGRLDLPVGGGPVYSYIEDDVALRSMKLARRILPRAEVKILADRNWTVQSVFAGVVEPFDQIRYAKEFSEYTGAAVVTSWEDDPASHINAVRQPAAETCLSNPAGYQDEADRRATLYQLPTGVWSYQTHQSAYLFQIGDEMEIVHPKFTGDGVVVGVAERIKGRSEIMFFAQLTDVYPTADIPVIA